MFSIALTFLLGSALVLGGPVNTTRPRWVSCLRFATRLLIVSRLCGTTISDEKLIAAEKHFAANRVSANDASADVTAINVHFHVIQKDDTLAGGNVP
jgi:hypothetical protein